VGDLLAAHGARAVEDEGEVDGEAARPVRRLGRLDLREQEAATSRPGLRSILTQAQLEER
jgi:hypothetical protein